jgi:hypothetical protein
MLLTPILKLEIGRGLKFSVAHISSCYEDLCGL